MSRLKDFKLPDLGEGLNEGEILSWSVKEGDTVALNQVIVEVETAKAAVEVPSPYAGVVTRIHAEAGTTVDVGTAIITVDTDPSAGPVDAPSQAPEQDPAQDLGDTDVTDMVPRPPADDAGPQGALIGEVGANGRTATLVGYGPRSVTAKRRPRADAPPAQRSEPAPSAPSAPARVSAQQVGQTAAVRSGGVTVLAKPLVRKLAKEHGVDLAALQGTGPGGVVTRADVEAVVRRSAVPEPATDSPEPGARDVGVRDVGSRETRVPIKGVRKHTAAAMVSSAFTAPHVTEFLTLDMTPTMELRSRVQAMPELVGVKVSPLLFVAKALLLAVSRHPGINSTWDEQAQEIVVKDYVNLGIAAATPRGLIVPNVKDADQLSLAELARALQDLAETAREGRTTPADMTGGTITITNVGMFGVDNGTPILNPGEAAILCFGAVRPMPWVVDGEVVVRQVTQLSLSFDHRIVDGQLGSQFLADVGRVLSDPVTALVWG
jgi:2-oxoisovalerate dehydrogenase E2 component (dihydrolipoyl transacylase)